MDRISGSTPINPGGLARDAAAADPATSLLLQPAVARGLEAGAAAIANAWAQARATFLQRRPLPGMATGPDPIAFINAVPRAFHSLSEAGLWADAADLSRFADRLSREYSVHYAQMTLAPAAPGASFWETGVAVGASGPVRVFTPAADVAGLRRRIDGQLRRQDHVLDQARGFLDVHAAEMGERERFAQRCAEVLPSLQDGERPEALHEVIAAEWIGYFGHALAGDAAAAANAHARTTARLARLPVDITGLTTTPSDCSAALGAVAAEVVGLNLAAERLLPALITATPGDPPAAVMPVLAAQLMGEVIVHLRTTNAVFAAMADQMPRHTPVNGLVLACTTVAGAQRLDLGPGDAATAHHGLGYDIAAAERLQDIVGCLADPGLGEISREMLLSEASDLLRGGPDAGAREAMLDRIEESLGRRHDADAAIAAADDIVTGLLIAGGPARDAVRARARVWRESHPLFAGLELVHPESALVTGRLGLPDHGEPVPLWPDDLDAGSGAADAAAAPFAPPEWPVGTAPASAQRGSPASLGDALRSWRQRGGSSGNARGVYLVQRFPAARHLAGSMGRTAAPRRAPRIPASLTPSWRSAATTDGAAGAAAARPGPAPSDHAADPTPVPRTEATRKAGAPGMDR